MASVLREHFRVRVVRSSGRKLHGVSAAWGTGSWQALVELSSVLARLTDSGGHGNGASGVRRDGAGGGGGAVGDERHAAREARPGRRGAAGRTGAGGQGRGASDGRGGDPRPRAGLPRRAPTGAGGGVDRRGPGPRARGRSRRARLRPRAGGRGAQRGGAGSGGQGGRGLPSPGRGRHCDPRVRPVLLASSMRRTDIFASWSRWGWRTRRRTRRRASSPTRTPRARRAWSCNSPHQRRHLRGPLAYPAPAHHVRRKKGS